MTYHDRMVAAYLQCALWASTDPDGEPLDEQCSADDWAMSAVQAAHSDCAEFVEMCQREGTDLLDAQTMGINLWLTRNHHGAGFWDLGLGEHGERLTAIAHTFSESDAYIGDDGQVYLS